VLAGHYAGDDTSVRTLLGGVLAAFAGITEHQERQGYRLLGLGACGRAHRPT
jgi:hypothetical protein